MKPEGSRIVFAGNVTVPVTLRTFAQQRTSRAFSGLARFASKKEMDWSWIED